MTYLWQSPGWPALRYEPGPLLSALVELSSARASLHERIGALGLGDRNELALQAFHGDALGTSEIEGERLPPKSVRSSIARRLGLPDPAFTPAPRDVEGLVELLDDATNRHGDPLTKERLFGWHAALFPTGYSHLSAITVGSWRQDPVSVRSGAAESEATHFEAPEPGRVEQEMAAFLSWWNADEEADSALKAGLGHLWFETVHPFDDGNGRIGRALIDRALAAGDNTTLRYYSVSGQISIDRDGYYEALEGAQRGGLDVTAWLEWFLGCTLEAVRAAESGMGAAVLRSRLRARLDAMELNPRQVKVLRKLIEHEPDGFEGGLTNAKHRSITGASKATATRDLADLVARGLLAEGEASGRSTRYHLSIEV